MNYGVTLHSSGVTFGTGASLENLDNPMLSYRFEELRIGETLVGSTGPVAPQVVPEERAVTYARGLIEERYLFKKDALEQIFVVRELPQGPAAITVTGAIETNLTPPADGTFARMLVFSHAGQEMITVSEAVAIDALGRRLELDLAYADGKMSLTVPAAWMADATLPITIDPLVGSSFTIDPTAQNPTNSSIAYSSTSNEWFVVWKEQVGAGTNQNDILGQRISASGTLLGSAFSIVGSVTDAYWPTVSWASSVNRYLVSWSGPDGGTSYNIFGRVVNSNGTFFTNTFTIGSDTALDTRPWAAFDGVNWYVAWANIFFAFPNQYRILGRFVSAAGTPGTQANPDTDLVTADNPRVDFTNGTYMIVWRKANAGATFWGLAGRTMNTGGGFGQPTPTYIVPSNTGVSGNDVSARPGQFLVVWFVVSSPTYLVRGRIANTTLGWMTSEFTIDYASVTLTSLLLSAAYSSTVDQWYVVYDDPYANGEVYGRRVYPGGTVALDADRITISAAPSQAPQVRWNSLTNEVLITYFEGYAPTYQLLAQRFSVALPPPPPAAPTGLTATAQNGKVSLTWNASTGATSYRIFRSKGGEGFRPVAETSTPSYVDPDLLNGITYEYLVVAINEGGESSESNIVTAVPIAPATLPALFVVGNTSLSTSDTAIKTRLEALGYALTIKSASASTTADAVGKALVFISASVSPSGVNTKFRDVAVPVICCEHGIYDDMGMTTAPTSQHGSQSGQTQLTIVDAGHPMAAGFPSGNVIILTTGRPLTWGKPSTSAARIATLVSDSTKFVIFGYEIGATMPVTPPGIAPARRVGFFLESATAQSLNANGDALLNAAVRWATNAPPTPLGFSQNSGDGRVSLQWAPSPGAISYNILMATSSGGPYSVVAGGITGNTYTVTSLTNTLTYYFRVVAQNESGFSGASATLSATPTDIGDIFIAVKGPPNLRTHPGGNPLPDELAYSVGTYEAIVRQDFGGLGMLDAAHTPLWYFDPASPNPGCLTIDNPNVNPATFRATGVPGTAKLIFEATVGTEPHFKTFEIVVGPRYGITVFFRFPQSNYTQGQTQRAPVGYTNSDLFRDTTDPNGQAIRGAARFAFSSPWINKTREIWRQSGVQVYFLTENVLGLRLDQTIPGTVYDMATHGLVTVESVPVSGSAQFRYVDTGAMRRLERLNVTAATAANYVNIYCFRGIHNAFAESKGWIVNGNTLAGLTRGPHRKTVVISDTANDQTLAHELGHVFGRDHVENANDIFGRVNNLVWVEIIGSNVPARSLLMWGNAGNRIASELRITDAEAEWARRDIDLMRPYLQVVND